MTVFDIETGPLPEDQLLPFAPDLGVDAGIPDPPPFDPGSVAVGNLKDPAKIEAKIAAAADAWIVAVESLGERREAARAKSLADLRDRAALSAVTGRVRAVGIIQRAFEPTGVRHVLGDDGRISVDEEDIIQFCWETLAYDDPASIVGHNIYGFDLPFLVRRSWLLGVEVPSWLRNGRYWSPRFVDLMDVWSLGGRRPDDSISLDKLARSLGLAGKPDGVGGADFARLYDGTPEERQQAVEYLKNDLRMTAQVADALGVL